MSIRSPKTGRLIKINGDTYKKLIKEGYFKRDKTAHVPEQILPDEMVEEILMHSPIENAMSICNSNKKFKKVCDSELFWEKMVNKYYADSGLLTLNKRFSEIFKIAYHLDLLKKTSPTNDNLLDWYEYDQITINQRWSQKYLDALYYMNGLEKVIFRVENFTDLQLLTHIPPNLKDIKYHKI